MTEKNKTCGNCGHYKRTIILKYCDHPDNYDEEHGCMSVIDQDLIDAIRKLTPESAMNYQSINDACNLKPSGWTPRKESE